VHDPTLPTVISTFRPAAGSGPVALVRHPVEREPATGVRCDTGALRTLLAGLPAGAVRLALVPEAMSDDDVAAWLAAAAHHEPADVAVTAGPVTDAVKAVDGDGRIVATVDREHLRWARTPALLPIPPLRAALASVTATVVDPISVLAAQGARVRCVER
jgi:hypothetical protein